MSFFSLIVTYRFHLTVIDGKVLSFLTETSSFQCCPICQATPTQMKDIYKIGTNVFRPKPGALKFGISPLHARIRFLELILHIAYRIDFKSK